MARFRIRAENGLDGGPTANGGGNRLNRRSKPTLSYKLGPDRGADSREGHTEATRPVAQPALPGELHP